MELMEKVIKAFKVCQTYECSYECPYLEGGDCKFQQLARDAEIVINKLYEKSES